MESRSFIYNTPNSSRQPGTPWSQRPIPISCIALTPTADLLCLSPHQLYAVILAPDAGNHRYASLPTLSVPTRRRRCGCDLLFLARTPPARVYPWCCRDLLLLASASRSNSFMCSTVASFNKILWIDVGPLHAGALIKTITSGDTNLMSSMFPWSYYILRTWVTESP